MSENFNHQGYRDDLSKNLKTARTLGEEGKDLAVDLLDSSKKTDQHEHLEENAQKEVHDIKDKIGGVGKDIITERGEKVSLGWGKVIENITYSKAEEKLAEMNKDTPVGKRWRFPFVNELQSHFEDDIIYEIRCFNKRFWINPNQKSFAHDSSRSAYLIISHRDPANLGLPEELVSVNAIFVRENI